MTLSLRFAARTDRGRLRQDNEDSLYAGPGLLAVADGMGGHVGGEIASRAVIETLRDLDRPGALTTDPASALRATIDAANRRLRRMTIDDPDLDGMGTTLTALHFDGEKLILAHVGDSRAYRLGDGQLTKITRDDTFVQALVDEGELTEAEAAVHPQRHMILRALTGLEVEVAVEALPARAGDRYLLTSDGLFDVVGADAIADAMADADLDAAVAELIALANAAGGPDNISCVLAEVVEGAGDTDPIVAGAVATPPDFAVDRRPEDAEAARDPGGARDARDPRDPGGQTDHPADPATEGLPRPGFFARLLGRRAKPDPAGETSPPEAPDRHPDETDGDQARRREEKR